jgi:hypothetical protein
MLEPFQLASDFARAFKAVDASAPVGKSRSRAYRPGIGPLAEAAALAKAFEILPSYNPQYAGIGSARYPEKQKTCDIAIPGQWVIEAKLVRPFGDNGKLAENWSVNLLHPYPGNESAIGDCYKLAQSGFKERKGILVFGFEHSNALVPLEPLIRAFEVVVTRTCDMSLGERQSGEFPDLIHPYHQRGRVYFWELGS